MPRVVKTYRIPHDFRRTAVRNLERAGVPRSTAMKIVGHKTESIYRCYAIADEVVLAEGGVKLEALYASHPHGSPSVASLDAVRKQTGRVRSELAARERLG